MESKPTPDNPKREEQNTATRVASKPNVPGAPENTTDSKQAKKDLWEMWKIFVETLTLLAVICYAGVAHNTLKEMRRSNNLAYRPYIGVNGIALKYAWNDPSGHFHFSDVLTKEANMLDFRAEIKNFGPVPGTNYAGKWRVFVGGAEEAVTKIPDRPFTFFPGQIAFLSGRVGTSDYPGVISGKEVLVVEITIEYDGPAGHYTECEKQQYAPSYNGFFDLGPCTDPN